ncbi:YceI family protein [Fluviicola sp.]|uniref:YceI family protein n=1 Tax=Fluviicola sp. TaxID=1917219 RepID=UPI002836727F|nr:YceI family protein [Fluviicola sp.]MDR0801379.1 YceI family protein [Fluviicola sp.]
MSVLLLIGGVFAFIQVPAWKVAKDYNIEFSAKGVDGVFKTFTATISFDEAKLAASRFVMTIDVNSINTGNGLQNKHAVSDEWFDAEKYPNIRFTSSSFEKTASGYSVKGKLQVKDVTKEVTIPFTFSKSGSKGKFAATFSIDRFAYNVGKSGGDVENNIKITATIPVTK